MRKALIQPRASLIAIAGAALALSVAPVSTAQRNASIIIVTAGKPSENTFLLSRASVRHGTVIFKITNLGKRVHTFGINGRTTKKLRPRQSTTLTVVFKKAARYAYSDTCIETPNIAEEQGQSATPAPCAGGFLKVI